MDGAGGADEAILAKARAGGPLAADAQRVLDTPPRSAAAAPAASSWRAAARAVDLKPSGAQPALRAFERSVLPTLRTLRAQFVCDVCPRCARPVIRSVLRDHVAQCEQRRATAQMNGTGAGAAANGHDAARADSSSAGAAAAGDAAVKAEDDGGEQDVRGRKKRRGDGDAEPAPKKAKTAKTKAAAKPKQARQPKQPREKASAVYSPDKNCGVLLPTGQPCMRSLTCKAHSMAQKRAVAGRSAAYDVMLSNYQRQHQMRQQHQQLSAVQVAQAESDQQLEAQAQQNPEREVQQVMEGMARVFCPPLDRRVVVSTQARSRNFRLREMLALALLPRRLAPTGDALFGRSLAFRPESPDILSPVRAPAVQQAIYLAQAQQMKLQQLRQQEQAAQASQAAPGGSQPAHANNPNMRAAAAAAGSQKQAQAHARFPPKERQ